MILGTGETLNTFDSVDGGAGQDTLNVIATGAVSVAAGASIENVEIINLARSSVSGTVDASEFGDAAEQVWQINAAGGIEGLTNDQTAGFRNVAPATTQGVTVGFSGTVANIALDKVDNIEFTVDDEDTGSSDVDLETVNFSGTTAGKLELGTASLGTVENINLALSTDTNISVQAAAALSGVVNIDASESTGDLVVGYAAVPNSKLESVVLGSGDDGLGIDLSNMDADELTVDLGAGNDVFELSAGNNTSADNALNITLGAGNDTLEITALSNISDITDIEADLITVADFNADADVLDLSGIIANTTGPVVSDRDVLTNTELANISAAADLAAAAEIAAQATTLDDYSIFDFGGDAYILQNDGGQGFDNGDGLVKIVGFQTDDIDGSNLVA